MYRGWRTDWSRPGHTRQHLPPWRSYGQVVERLAVRSRCDGNGAPSVHSRPAGRAMRRPRSRPPVGVRIIAALFGVSALLFNAALMLSDRAPGLTRRVLGGAQRRLSERIDADSRVRLAADGRLPESDAIVHIGVWAVAIILVGRSYRRLGSCHHPRWVGSLELARARHFCNRCARVEHRHRTGSGAVLLHPRSRERRRRGECHRHRSRNRDRRTCLRSVERHRNRIRRRDAPSSAPPVSLTADRSRSDSSLTSHDTNTGEFDRGQVALRLIATRSEGHF